MSRLDPRGRLKAVAVVHGRLSQPPVHLRQTHKSARLMKTRNVICALALTLVTTLTAQTLPAGRTITDTQGRSMDGTILSKTDAAIKFRRASDGKEFEVPYDKLSVIDRISLGITPPDALDSQRFPYRIHAPLRKHGNPNGGTTTIEPGEPVEMVAQDGKTITILHAGQELEFEIPPANGEATAKAPAKSKWTPAFPDMETSEFFAEVYKRDTDRPFDIAWRQVNKEHHQSAVIFFKIRDLEITTGSRTPEFVATRASILPENLKMDAAAASGLMYLDILTKRRKIPPVEIDEYLKRISEVKAAAGIKAGVPTSKHELAKVYNSLKHLGKHYPEPIKVDSKRLAPVFPFAQHNEIIVQIAKRPPNLISTIVWKGKDARGVDIGKTHTTIAIGYDSDGTIKGTTLQCLDADGQIRSYPAEDVFSVWDVWLMRG